MCYPAFTRLRLVVFMRSGRGLPGRGHLWELPYQSASESG